MRSRRNLRFFAGILACAVLAPVWAQTDWEGSAAVGRYGEFPPGGLYVASNTFPLNSLIDVTNPATGRRARLIVVRETGDSGVFMLLSEAAASALGVTGNATATVRATPVQLPGLTSVDPNQDLPFHPDPDVNPSASLGDPNASIMTPRSLREDAADVAEESPAARTATAPAISPAESVAAAEAAVSGPEPEPETAPEPEPESAAVAEAPPEPEPEPEPEPQPELTPESAAVAEAPPEPETPSEPEPDPVIEEDESAAEAAPPAIAPPSLAVVIEPDGPDAAVEPTSEIAEESTPSSIEAMTPPEDSIIAAAVPDREDEFGELPEVDLSGAIVVDVTDPLPESPNPVQVVVELPEVEDTATPQLSELMPERPVLEENEIALPIAPLDELESEPVLATPRGEEDEPVASALPEPAEPAEPEEPGDVAAEAAPEREELRPGLIPEDAIVSLEPAEFRSPDPPEPTVDDVVAETPAEEELEAPENIAVVSDDETAAEEPAPPEEEEAAPTVAEADAEAESEADAEVEAEAEPVRPRTAERVTEITDLPIVSDLDGDASWVQVAAFSNPQSVRRTIDTLGAGVPVAVLSQPSGDAALYRVYVGPLSEDEKGSMLFRVRSRGFRDAFVR